jgi:hypothetical protein
MNKSIYVIFQDDYTWEYSIPIIKGYVTTEEAAQEAVKQLTEAIPKCPFDEVELGDFEEVLFRCEEEFSDIDEDLWSQDPYKTSDGRVTDIEKHARWMELADAELHEQRLHWFEKNAPQYTEEQIRQYWKWESTRYSDPVYSYQQVKQIPVYGIQQ